jgi:tRNA(fMet)-specific endonuclease VapC
MSLWILDTNLVSEFLRENPVVVARVSQNAPSSLAVTVVTAEEICQGWLSEINKRNNKTSQASRLLLAYAEFQKALEFFKITQIIGFDDNSYKHFVALRLLLGKRNSNDMKIAAIALSVNATLVTRNRQDFEKVPNLAIADWSVESA